MHFPVAVYILLFYSTENWSYSRFQSVIVIAENYFKVGELSRRSGNTRKSYMIDCLMRVETVIFHVIFWFSSHGKLKFGQGISGKS